MNILTEMLDRWARAAGLEEVDGKEANDDDVDE